MCIACLLLPHLPAQALSQEKYPATHKGESSAGRKGRDGAESGSETDAGAGDPIKGADTGDAAARSETAFFVVEGGRVIDVSRPLQPAGIPKGITLERARALCPDAEVRSRDTSLEEVLWEDILVRLNRYTPRLEAAGIGRAFFRPPPKPSLHQLARAFEGCIGTGKSRSVASLAAVSSLIGADSGAGRITDVQHEGSFFGRTSVAVLAGLDFAEEMVERLELFGLRTLQDARELTCRHLEAQFGEEGGRLYELLHPSPDERPLSLFQPPAVVSYAYDVEHPYQAERELAPALSHLAPQASGALEERSCRRLAIRLLCGSEEIRKVHIFHEPVRDADLLERRAQRLLDALLEMHHGAKGGRENLHRKEVDKWVGNPQQGGADEKNWSDKPGGRVDILPLELGALCQPETQQRDFFDRRPALHRILRHLLRRYPGKMARSERHPPAPFEEDTMRLIPIEPE